MIQKRWPTFVAILVIVIFGFLYSNGYVNRGIALSVVLSTFLLCQATACYLMHKDHEDWRRLAIMSATFALIMAVLLFM